MSRPRHAKSCKKNLTQSLAAFAAVAAVSLGSVTPSLEVPATASASTIECTDASTLRVVFADPLLMSVVRVFIPGTGYTPYYNDNTLLDGGVYSHDGEALYLTDPKVYPGKLGANNLDGITGQISVEMGAAGAVGLVSGHDPATTVYHFVGGSQGAMVAALAAISLIKQGVPPANIFLSLYSDPYTPVTGIVDRFTGKSIFGLKGGAPAIPDGVTALRVNNEYDPIAFFPKELYNVPALINAVFGFFYKHGDISDIDYSNPLNTVVVDGNVTTVTIGAPVLPMLMPLQQLGVPKVLVALLDRLFRPVIDASVKASGNAEIVPTVEGLVKLAKASGVGVWQLFDGIVRLVQHRPLNDPVEQNPSTTPPSQVIVDETNTRDDELDSAVDSTPYHLQATQNAAKPEAQEPELAPVAKSDTVTQSAEAPQPESEAETKSAKEESVPTDMKPAKSESSTSASNSTSGAESSTDSSSESDGKSDDSEPSAGDSRRVAESGKHAKDNSDTSSSAHPGARTPKKPASSDSIGSSSSPSLGGGDDSSS